MERIQLISFPRMTSFFKPHEVPEKTSHLHPPPPHLAASPWHQAAVPRRQPAQRVAAPASMASRPGQGPFPEPAGRSQVLASRTVSCHDTSPVLFSLPLYRREMLMYLQVPQDPQDGPPAWFPPLIAAADTCRGLRWTGRVSCSGDCCSCRHDPGMQAPDHTPQGSKSIGACSPEPAPCPYPPPRWLLFPFDFEYSYFSSTLSRI